MHNVTKIHTQNDDYMDVEWLGSLINHAQTTASQLLEVAKSANPGHIVSIRPEVNKASREYSTRLHLIAENLEAAAHSLGSIQAQISGEKS